jgi:hypothetical protein
MVIFLGIAVLLGSGIFVGWRVVDEAVADVYFSTATTHASSSSINSLLIDNVTAEIGDMVFLNDVKLAAGPKGRLFVISDSGGKRMLVALKGAQKLTEPLPLVVDIKGIIRSLPAPQILRREWMLSKEQIEAFGPQHIYIDAEYISD